MKRAAYLLIVLFAGIQLMGCETTSKGDHKSGKMDCCGDMSCCSGMKTDGACSADCKADCCMHK